MKAILLVVIYLLVIVCIFKIGYLNGYRKAFIDSNKKEKVNYDIFG